MREATEPLNPIFPATSALATALVPDIYCCSTRDKDATIPRQTGQEGKGKDQILQDRKMRRWQAYPPSFLQDVLLLRPF